MTDEPMMMTWPSDELGRRLAAYALTVSPSTDASARLKAGVMAQAAERLRPRPLAERRAPAREPAPLVPLAGAGFAALRRRAAIAVVAAGIAGSGLAGVVAAADPGGPLYETRLWAEALTLPTDPGARVDADVARLGARLSEARRATQAGNANGARAALDAYVAVLDDAIAAAGTDATRDGRIATALDSHRTVLSALALRLPDRAAAAVGRALDRTDAAIEHLQPDRSKGGNPPDVPGSNGKGAGSGAGPGGNSGQRASASPPGSDQATDKPTPSRSPRPKPSPTATGAPTPTPSEAAPSASLSSPESEHGPRGPEHESLSSTDQSQSSGVTSPTRPSPRIPSP